MVRLLPALVLFLCPLLLTAAPVYTPPPGPSGGEGSGMEGSAPVSPPAQVGAGESQPPSASAPSVPVKPPFVGVIAVKLANVRGGPSLNHFPLARLPRGTEVRVLEEVGGWYRIAPPPGVFCWVHKDLVKLAPDGKSAVIAASRVNIRGDSILGHPPLKSDVIDQVDEGLKVEVVGREGDFLRIKPTPNARVYVRADLVKPKTPTAPAERVLPEKRGEDEKLLAAFRRAEKALKSEHLKPPTQWDLGRLRAMYEDIAGRARKGSRLQAVARARLEYLDRLVLLKSTVIEVERGRQETERALAAIEQRLQAEEAALRQAELKTPRFTVVGLVQPLVLSDGRERFKLVSPQDPNNILCVLKGDSRLLRSLVGKTVGLRGTFRVTTRWPVRLLEVSAAEVLGAGGGSGRDTRIARPPEAGR